MREACSRCVELKLLDMFIRESRLQRRLRPFLVHRSTFVKPFDGVGRKLIQLWLGRHEVLYLVFLRSGGQVTLCQQTDRLSCEEGLSGFVSSFLPLF